MTQQHDTDHLQVTTASAGQMRAVIVREFGPPDVLTVVDWPRPDPAAGEVLIRVGASSVAFGRDVEVRGGRHPFFPRLIQFPHIFGGEHAGTVAAVGAGVPAELIGKRVAVTATVACGRCEHCESGNPGLCVQRRAIGIHLPGSNAEFTVVPQANLQQIPDSMSFELAAALAASGPLAYEQIQVGQVGGGDWVAVPGASGAVGTLLVALAARRGANVIALTRGRRAESALLALGAKLVLDTSDPGLGNALLRHTGTGVNAVIDNVASADLWLRYWPAVARGGRVVFSGYAGKDNKPLPVNVVELYNRHATLSGLTTGNPKAVVDFWAEMRTRPINLAPDFIQAFPLDRTADAHLRIENGEKIGHYVVSIADDRKPV